MELDADRPEPGGVAPSPPVLRAPTPQEQEEAERLIREGVIARRRGDLATATARFEAAVKVAPGSPDVVVVLAEDWIERRQWRKAKELLEAGLQVSPDHRRLGELHAEAVYALLSGDFDFTRPIADVESVANTKAATLLSALIPGLGQLVNGRTQIGAIMLAGWLICGILLFLIPNGASGLLALVTGSRGGTQFNGLALLPLFGSIGFLLWSVIDAQRTGAPVTKSKIVRPTPPVDKDFELK